MSHSHKMQSLRLPSFLSPHESFTSLGPITTAIPVPKPNEVLVRVTHVSPQQVDLLYARGQHQNNNARHGHVHPPFTLGLDFAGVVASSSDAELRTGDRVVASCLGAFAEYITVPRTSVRKVPDGVSSAKAAALVGGVVSYAAVKYVADARRGETVLVTGVPGGLGVVAACVARERGVRVFVLARNKDKAQAVKARMPGVEVLGADQDWPDAIRRATAGQGVDVVIDNVGVVEDALRCIRFGGRIVLVGFAGRKGVMEKIGMNKILLKGATVIGYRYGEALRRGQGPAAETLWKEYAALVERNAIIPLLHDKHYVGVASIPQALDDLDRGRTFGKAVIAVDETQKSML